MLAFLASITANLVKEGFAFFLSFKALSNVVIDEPVFSEQRFRNFSPSFGFRVFSLLAEGRVINGSHARC